jgi:hypothetical protein
MDQRPKVKGASTPVGMTFGERAGKAEYTVVQRIGGLTVQVRIVVDTTYAQQSLAVAEVLTPALTWTKVADLPPSLWHGRVAFIKTESGSVRLTTLKHPPEELHQLELDLFVQAAAVLDV